MSGEDSEFSIIFLAVDGELTRSFEFDDEHQGKDGKRQHQHHHKKDRGESNSRAGGRNVSAGIAELMRRQEERIAELRTEASKDAVEAKKRQEHEAFLEQEYQKERQEAALAELDEETVRKRAEQEAKLKAWESAVASRKQKSETTPISSVNMERLAQWEAKLSGKSSSARDLPVRTKDNVSSDPPTIPAEPDAPMLPPQSDAATDSEHSKGEKVADPVQLRSWMEEAKKTTSPRAAEDIQAANDNVSSTNANVSERLSGNVANDSGTAKRDSSSNNNANASAASDRSKKVSNESKSNTSPSRKKHTASDTTPADSTTSMGHRSPRAASDDAVADIDVAGKQHKEHKDTKRSASHHSSKHSKKERHRSEGKRVADHVADVELGVNAKHRSDRQHRLSGKNANADVVEETKSKEKRERSKEKSGTGAGLKEKDKDRERRRKQRNTEHAEAKAKREAELAAAVEQERRAAREAERKKREAERVALASRENSVAEIIALTESGQLSRNAQEKEKRSTKKRTAGGRSDASSSTSKSAADRTGADESPYKKDRESARLMREAERAATLARIREEENRRREILKERRMEADRAAAAEARRKREAEQEKEKLRKRTEELKRSLKKVEEERAKVERLRAEKKAAASSGTSDSQTREANAAPTESDVDRRRRERAERQKNSSSLALNQTAKSSSAAEATRSSTAAVASSTSATTAAAANTDAATATASKSAQDVLTVSPGAIERAVTETFEVLEVREKTGPLSSSELVPRPGVATSSPSSSTPGSHVAKVAGAGSEVNRSSLSASATREVTKRRTSMFHVLKDASSGWNITFSDLSAANNALEDVRDESVDIDWAIFGYLPGHQHTMTIVAVGRGGCEEIKKHVEEDAVQYAYLRVSAKLQSGIVEKFVAVTFIGRKARYITRRICMSHKSSMIDFFRIIHVELQGTRDEIDDHVIIDAVVRAAGQTRKALMSQTVAKHVAAADSPRSHHLSSSVFTRRAMNTNAGVNSLDSPTRASNQSILTAGTGANDDDSASSGARRRRRRSRHEGDDSGAMKRSAGRAASAGMSSVAATTNKGSSLNSSRARGSNVRRKAFLAVDTVHLVDSDDAELRENIAAIQREKGNVSWVVLAYDSQSLSLHKEACGTQEHPLAGVRDSLPPNAAAYAYMRVPMSRGSSIELNTTNTKLVLVHWVPDTVKPLFRGKIGQHKSAVRDFIGPHNAYIEVDDRKDLQDDTFNNALLNALGDRGRVR